MSVDLKLKETIQEGSKSFSMAARFFPEEKRRSVWALYAWCRFTDDQIDQAENSEQQLQRLESLRVRTDLALKGELKEPISAEGAWIFTELARLGRDYRLPSQYFHDLLDGMQMDVQGSRIRTEEELELYCYRVAGVVGLLMAHIMGVSHERALESAVSMGIAMQLTNISRDFYEDFQMGRVYLPDTWLSETGLDKRRLFDPSERDKLWELVIKSLKKAEQCYQTGYAGLRDLDFRSAFVIASAGEIYSRIGKVRLRLGPDRIQERAIVPKREKWFCVAKAVVRVMPLLFKRMIRPWKPKRIELTWHFGEGR